MEAWEDLVAQEWSGIGGVLIGGVGGVGELVLVHVVQGLGAGDAEQGTKEVALGGGHAADSAGAGAAGEVEQDGLGLVGGGVARGDEAGAVACGYSPQGLVSDRPGLCHEVASGGDLDRDPFKGDVV